MLRHPDYTRTRIQQLTERIGKLIYADTRPASEILVAGPVDRITYGEAQSLEYRAAVMGQALGPEWATFWFRTQFQVPQEWAGQRVDLLFVTYSEATLWQDGRSVQGLNTGGAGDRPDAIVIREAAGGETLELQIEMACNNKFGLRGGDGL